MSATNRTTNYNLPQFISSDVPTWLVDVNGAMSAIDTAMKANADSASAAASAAATADTKAETAAGNIQQTNAALAALQSTVQTNTAAIAANTSKIGAATLNTGAQNLSGAVNELYAALNTVQMATLVGTNAYGSVTFNYAIIGAFVYCEIEATANQAISNSLGDFPFANFPEADFPITIPLVGNLGSDYAAKFCSISRPGLASDAKLSIRGAMSANETAYGSGFYRLKTA